ncbi:PD-(D/E)XK motif protein [Serratia fonticola]|uniref:PD-(D/E)XK motif protein n=1 Tax=Serratia fonticola TaxID=47917 RepID=UPI003AAE1A54
MMNKNLRERWESLVADSSKPVFQLIDADHPLDFYIGKDPSGNLLILLVTDHHANIVKQMKYVKVDVFEREDGRWSLLIRLLSLELIPIFLLFCTDLIDSSRNLVGNECHITYVMSRIALWQRLLERNNNGLLSPSEVRGLVGELVFLMRSMVPLYGKRDAVDSWVGVYGAAQDFRLLDKAWEIKSIHPDSSYVRISSAEQLHSNIRSIKLVTVSLSEIEEKSEKASSLNEFVTQARRLFLDLPDVATAFEQRLVEIGFFMRKEYDMPFFVVNEVCSYGVEDGFPRLYSTQIHPGIQSVNYEVTLEACKSYLIETLK